MKYLWTEDGGAGLQFWKLVNQYLFQGELMIESKGSNQGILDAENTLQLMLEAETEEQREFYQVVGDFLLQKKQREEIGKGKQYDG